ncbi:MAG: extracellular solute-binding protein [Chloroflexi bacterium]|nr:extracellular solute-binding protein [Chloroflexota bacterium]MCY3581368.1 extracellular solute-binding protein [Chloroflexota bacterium]MCY3717755.1 extracellular solute-binding protein [Chloroflexota bacterium]MDE2651978.1 extracellular solute-binding protein [Chloroflexota bacterium]
MQHMKRVPILLMLLLLLSLGFAAQAQDSISFLTPSWGVPPDEEALNAFMEESGITVEIQSVQMADLYSRVQVAAAAMQAPADVIFITEEAPSNVVATGNMMSLNDMVAMGDLDIDDFEKVDFFTLDGELMAIPVYQQLVMMDYNSARTAEAGFDAPPTTWAELYDQSVAIRDAGIDEHPIAMGAIHWSWWLMALSMGDPMFDDDLNPVFADEGSKAREAMALLKTFFDEELVSPEILAGSINQHGLFWSGVGTFHQGWQGSVVVGNGENSLQAPHVEYMVLPEVGNTWSFPAGIGISVDSENAEAAWEFIKWYVSEGTQRAIFGAFGLYPSRTSVAAALNEEGAVQGYDEIVAQSMLTNELPRFTLWWGPWAASVSEVILEGLQMGTPADDMIDALAEEWNALKEEYM